jgi:hypothetical protein
VKLIIQARPPSNELTKVQTWNVKQFMGVCYVWVIKPCIIITNARRSKGDMEWSNYPRLLWLWTMIRSIILGPTCSLSRGGVIVVGFKWHVVL